MAKQKPGVYDRVLECAKDEFLSKGFLDASLRAIAQEAGTSTGSIYTRFGDKEGLFRASWWTLRWSTPTSTWRSSAARA